MRWYVYVWYDSEWMPYYVGKGVGTRCRRRRGIPHPEEGHVVLKHFELEEQAFEHEKQLISFWGRREFDDNGLLMNRALGGPGAPGVPMSQEHREYVSAKASARNRTPEQAEAVRRYQLKRLQENPSLRFHIRKHQHKAVEALSKAWIVTSPDQKEHVVTNMQQFGRQHNLNANHLRGVARGERKHHKGWTARYA